MDRPDAPGTRLKIEVQDTGVGIPQQNFDSIMIPFKRGTDTAYAEGGSGLGLSIVERLVQALGGEFELESEVGQGSTFTVRIPVEPAPHGDSAPPAER